jgi:hypothetical protein
MDKGGRCIGLTTLLSSFAACLEILGASPCMLFVVGFIIRRLPEGTD